MKSYDVYGIGNALVDTEYEVDDAFLLGTQFPKGIMTIIQEDDRQQLINRLENEHEHVVIKRAGGGSAANTMVVVSQLGGSAFYSCKVAADSVGDFFMQDLQAIGVDTNLGEVREQGATGQCISMVTPDAERTMTTCLGITQTLSTNEINPRALAASTLLYIEGYLVSSPSGFQAALAAQDIAIKNNVQVALTLSDPLMVKNFKSQYEQFFDKGVDLLFCNLEEARLVTGSDELTACIRQLREICHRFAITLGKDGATVFDGNLVSRVPGIPTTAVDTTGAGDIFAGAFMHTICRGKPWQEAATLANRAASALVSRFGARLTQADLIAALNA